MNRHIPDRFVDRAILYIGYRIIEVGKDAINMPDNYFNYLGPEDKLHHSILEFIKLSYPRAIVAHPPNEGKRTPFERFKAKYLGISAGLPDIMVFTPNAQGYHGLALEIKIKPNKMTPAQIKWHEQLFKCRWQCACVYDLDGAMEVIDTYFSKAIVGSNSN